MKPPRFFVSRFYHQPFKWEVVDNTGRLAEEDGYTRRFNDGVTRLPKGTMRFMRKRDARRRCEWLNHHLDGGEQ